MKLIDLKCPNCAATMKYDDASGQCTCESCGATFLVEDDEGDKSVDPEDLEEAGYQFEKGRQRALNEEKAQTAEGRKEAAFQSAVPKVIWVIGWIVMYPIPASVLLNRSKRLSYPAKVILIILVWISYLIMLVIGYLQD